MRPPAPPAPPRGGLQRLFRTSLVLIPIGVAGNIALSLLTTDRALLAAIGEFPRGYLLLAVALGLTPWLTNTLRMVLWTDFLGRRLSLRDSFRVTLAGDVGAAISPTLVGGAFFKWGMLVERGLSPGAAASLTTLGNIEDAVFFSVAVPLSLYLTHAWELPALQSLGLRFQTNTLPAIAVTGGIAVLSWAAVRLVLRGHLGASPRQRGLKLTARLRRRARTTWRDARAVFQLIWARGKTRFALALSLTAIHWIARYSVVSALIAFLGVPVRPVLFWALQWVVFTLTALLPTPGGTGGAEAAFFLIYSAFVPSHVLGLATAGWRFLTFYLQIGLGALLFAALNTRVRKGVQTPINT